MLKAQSPITDPASASCSLRRPLLENASRNARVDSVRRPGTAPFHHVLAFVKSCGKISVRSSVMCSVFRVRPQAGGPRMSDYEHHRKHHRHASDEDSSKDDVEAHRHRHAADEGKDDDSKESTDPDVEAHRHRWNAEEAAGDSTEADVEAHRHRHRHKHASDEGTEDSTEPDVEAHRH